MLHVICLLACSTLCQSAVDLPSPERWEADIQKIEQRLKDAPPEPGGVVFVGSSTIRLWDLQESFPGLGAVNCGFGGSFMRDSVRYAERIILPLKPEIVVVYAGDNDITHGLDPQHVADDFKALVEKIHAALPDTHVIYLSIKPSIARWDKWPRMQQANELIQAHTRTNPRLSFLDMTSVSLGKDGKPRQDFLKDDGLHLNKEGYKAWSALAARRLSELRAAK